jgi:hypothetical protein
MAKKTNRDDELGKRPKIREHLVKMFQDIEQAFIEQHQRSDDIADYWDCYNCQLGPRQFYDGNSQIFVPIVKNAVKARKTRFLNQIFPQAGRYVEVTTSDGDLPQAQMSLAEHYIRTSKLRTEVMPALLVNGDVEGQYSVYVTWEKTEKNAVGRVERPFESDGLSFEELGTHEDIEEDEIVEQGPHVEVVNDSDIMILPVTADSIPQAIMVGGSVTIMRRWTKAMIKQKKKDGEIIDDIADQMIKEMSQKRPAANNRDTKKEAADAAGIKTGGGDKYFLVYEAWTRLMVDGDLRLCRAYWGGDDQVLGCKINPYWCDEVPLISCPVEKVSGVFKGRAPLADVIDIQVLANDATNEGADAAHFSAMPIIMTDPEKNPKVGTMVLGLASIWETSPKDTQFAQFPDLWNAAIERVAACKSEIFQTLGVNPSMVAQGTGSKSGKRNQAEIATEQQVDLLTTADAVTVIEEGILTPLIQRFMAYDHQFRDKAITIRQFGEMGMKANMEEVPPIQMNNRYEYRWFGVEQARNAAQIQQQIAMANVIKGIPPQMYQGYRLNLTPLITRLADNTFGHRLAPLIFEKVQGVTVNPDMENDLLAQGFETPVHPDDNDAEHIAVHLRATQAGDHDGRLRMHIMAHQAQMQAKAMAAMQQAGGQPGLPGAPGGAGPGVAGTPRPGVQPAGPRLLKQPEGAINQDRLPRAGAVTMPRKM